jgi:hypothetical protein
MNDRETARDLSKRLERLAAENKFLREAIQDRIMIDNAFQDEYNEWLSGLNKLLEEKEGV